MAIYNLFDLLERTSEIINSGYSFAEISELPSEDDLPAELTFDVFVEDGWCKSINPVESVPENSDFSSGASLSINTICYSLSLKETATIANALDNYLHYLDDCSSDKNIPKSELDKITKLSVECRNILSKMSNFLNAIK